jgi:glutamine synthetase
MAHLPSVAALTLPIPASYKRVNDGVWSGGTYICWRTENREAPTRLTNSASPTSRRFEVRCVSTANPHIVLAGILSAGYLGIRSNLELTMSDCPGPKTAAQMSEEDRRALGIYKECRSAGKKQGKALRLIHNFHISSGESSMRNIYR